MDENDYFQRVNQSKSFVTSLQTNHFPRIPIRFPQLLPVLVPPPLGSFNVGFPMNRFPYNSNSNGVLSVPNAFNLGQPIVLPTPSLIMNGINGSNDFPEKQFFCRLCSSFSSHQVKEFQEHLNIHCSPHRPFNCQICGKVFQFRSLWRNHIISHMTIKRSDPLKYLGHNRSQIDTNNGKLYEECGYNCKSKMRSEKDDNICPLKCTQCEYETDTRTKLERHESTHIRNRPFSCVECNSTFSQSGSLKGHLIKVHKINEFMVGCSYCQDFKVRNFGLLWTHIEKVHENNSFKYFLIKSN